MATRGGVRTRSRWMGSWLRVGRELACSDGPDYGVSDGVCMGTNELRIPRHAEYRFRRMVNTMG